MTVGSPAPSAPSNRRSLSGRAKLAWVVLLWVAAGSIFAAYLLFARHVAAQAMEAARGHGAMLAASDRSRGIGLGAPLLLILAALILQVRWTRGFWRGFAGIGLAGLLPAGFVALLVIGMGGPTRLDSVRLRNGQSYILALEPVMTDSVYTLYEPAKPLGLAWRMAAWLDYSEDGRFIGDERLVVSPDEQWLLVGRAGLWTDCFRLGGPKPLPCQTGEHPDWSDPGYEAAMRRRSEDYARRSGVRP